MISTAKGNAAPTSLWFGGYIERVTAAVDLQDFACEQYLKVVCCSMELVCDYGIECPDLFMAAICFAISARA